MSPELSRRVAYAMNRNPPSMSERVRIMTAVKPAKTFDDLPAAIQALIASLEHAKPRSRVTESPGRKMPR